MGGDLNLSIIYNNASRAAKNLFKEVGGTDLLIKARPNSLERGSADYQRELKNVLLMLLNTDAVSPEDVMYPGILFDELAKETSELWGSTRAGVFLRRTLGDTEVKESIKDSIQVINKRSYGYNFEAGEDSLEESYDVIMRTALGIVESYRNLERLKVVKQIIPNLRRTVFGKIKGLGKRIKFGTA